MENLSATPASGDNKSNNNIGFLLSILIILVVVLIGIVVYLLIQNNKLISSLSSGDNQTAEQISTVKLTQDLTKTITPSPTMASKENILKISDIQFTFPEGYKIVSTTTNTAKILTDYKSYQVYLLLTLDQNSKSIESAYESRTNVVRTKYAEVYQVAGSGFSWTGAIVNNKKYSFIWEIDSNQQPPSNLDGIWVPDTDLIPEKIFEITKTVKQI